MPPAASEAAISTVVVVAVIPSLTVTTVTFSVVAEILTTTLKAGTGTDVEALQSRVDKLAAAFPL